jgi:hypothetical protein
VRRARGTAAGEKGQTMSESIAEEVNGTRRVIATPLANGKPARTYSTRDESAVYLYEYAGHDADGKRVYRRMGTERLK